MKLTRYPGNILNGRNAYKLHLPAGIPTKAFCLRRGCADHEHERVRRVPNACEYEVAGGAPLTPGKHVVTLDFNYDGGGVGKGGTACTGYLSKILSAVAISHPLTNAVEINSRSNGSR